MSVCNLTLCSPSCIPLFPHPLLPTHYVSLCTSTYLHSTSLILMPLIFPVLVHMSASVHIVSTILQPYVLHAPPYSYSYSNAPFPCPNGPAQCFLHMFPMSITTCASISSLCPTCPYHVFPSPSFCLMLQSYISRLTRYNACVPALWPLFSIFMSPCHSLCPEGTFWYLFGPMPKLIVIISGLNS